MSYVPKASDEEERQRAALLDPILSVCADHSAAAVLAALLDAVVGILLTQCETVDEAVDYLDATHREMRRTIAEEWAEAKIELASDHQPGNA